MGVDREANDIGRHTIRARATDAAGNTQPDVPPWNRLGYGNNAIEVVYIDVRRRRYGNVAPHLRHGVVAVPIADITDLYASFPSPERQGYLVLVLNTLPFAPPTAASPTRSSIGSGYAS